MAVRDHIDIIYAPVARLPDFGAAVLVWLRIGCLSFGGPAGQIALLHHEVVEQRRWVSEARFLHALNFCTLLPGPEAQQLAIYLGWLMHGVPGGLAAGLLFIAPGAVVMLGLSVLYATLGAVPLVAALFFGLKSAVLVLVVDALLRIGRRALKTRAAWAVSGLAFMALFLFAVPFPVTVLAAGLLGLAAPGWFAAPSHGKAASGAPALLDALLAADPGRARRQARGALQAGLLALLAWALPVVLLWRQGGVLLRVAVFFSKLAIVTFGGAYAVLAYVAQEAVQAQHWLTPADMLSGLGLAETTPGPLILVSQFVGFLAGFHAAGLAGGVAASALTLWVTFAPCFAFVFLGAPLVESLRENRVLSGALSAITAAVVGVIANLAAWFGLHVLFARTLPVRGAWLHVDLPVPASLDGAALALAAVAAVCLLRLRLGAARTLGICAACSCALHGVGALR